MTTSLPFALRSLTVYWTGHARLTRSLRRNINWQLQRGGSLLNVTTLIAWSDRMLVSTAST